MALFSRRKKNDAIATQEAPPAEPRPAERPPAVPPPAVPPPAEPPPAEPPPAEDPTPPDVPAGMTISVSAFQGVGAPARPEPAAAAMTPERAARPAAAPAPTKSIPGLRDNGPIREALAGMSQPPVPAELLEVARQLLQGHLFLRVKGDARSLLAEGKDLPLGVVVLNDQQYVLAYSSGAALRAGVAADRDSDTSAMGQPVLSVLRHVLAGSYAGLILDHSSAPARAVLPRDLLQKLIDQGGGSTELKSLLCEQRTEATVTAVADALVRAKFWVAVNRSPEGRLGVAEARTTQGERLLELYSHPIEVATLGRGDQAAPMTAPQLAAALRADEQLAGVIVDSRGPWIRLSREDLAPLLALPA